LQRLNTLVSAYFDAAGFRALKHEPTCMNEWLAHLDRLIVAMEGKDQREGQAMNRIDELIVELCSGWLEF